MLQGHVYAHTVLLRSVCRSCCKGKPSLESSGSLQQKNTTETHPRTHDEVSSCIGVHPFLTCGCQQPRFCGLKAARAAAAGCMHNSCMLNSRKFQPVSALIIVCIKMLLMFMLCLPSHMLMRLQGGELGRQSTGFPSGIAGGCCY